MSINGRILKADAPWLLRVVAGTVALIILISFVLSFNSQQDLAIAAHIPVMFAWGWPLIVDGTIIVATFGVLILEPRGRRTVWYPWAILILFGALSIYANGVHATGREPSIPEAFVIGAVPALALLLSTHLLVMMLTSPEEVASDEAKVEELRVAATPEPVRPTPVEPVPAEITPVVSAPAAPAAPEARPAVKAAPKPAARRPVKPGTSGAGLSQEQASRKALKQFHDTGQWPTGTVVGEWMGKSYKSGQRALAAAKENL